MYFIVKLIIFNSSIISNSSRNLTPFSPSLTRAANYRISGYPTLLKCRLKTPMQAIQMVAIQ